jgi:hypothetical protein
VQAGTWALFKWKGSEALKQLNLNDTYLSVEETVIYKLSMNAVLGEWGNTHTATTDVFYSIMIV